MCIRESHRDEKFFPIRWCSTPNASAARIHARRVCAVRCVRLGIGEDVTKAVAGSFAPELARGFDWKSSRTGPPGSAAGFTRAPPPTERRDEAEGTRSMSVPPRVTVIVPAFQSEARISSTLHRLERQTRRLPRSSS
jgi:hypothetical protein